MKIHDCQYYQKMLMFLSGFYDTRSFKLLNKFCMMILVIPGTHYKAFKLYLTKNKNEICIFIKEVGMGHGLPSNDACSSLDSYKLKQISIILFIIIITKQLQQPISSKPSS